MFKKYIILIAAVFGLSPLSHGMGMHEEASGFSGSFELEYTGDLSEDGANLGSFDYRARAYWAGEVNSMVSWKVGFSTNVEEQFSKTELAPLFVEQAYFSYRPVDVFYVKVGKYQLKKRYHSSVLYDEDIFVEGVMAKLYQEVGDVKVFGKAYVYHLDKSGPFSQGLLLDGKVGVKADFSGIKVGVYAGGQYDGLNNQNEITTTLMNMGLHLHADTMQFPVGFFSKYGTNLDTAFENHTYNVGIYLGENTKEENDFSVSVSYYDVDTTSWNADFLDDDFIEPGQDQKGVAVSGNYNPMESVTLGVRYALDIGGTATNQHNVVGNLRFDF